MKKRCVEIIVRGVCVVDGALLVCRSRGATNTFLPGGHLEFGESARSALTRELVEEMGKDSCAGTFLGAVEHTFVQKGEPHCEVNLVFSLEIPGIAPSAAPASCESQLSFQWVPLGEMAEAQVEPAPLVSLVPEWVAMDGGGAERWGSTFG